VLRVGLTGGIGAGKSTVALALGRLGAVVVDADQLARRVVERGSPGLDAVVEAFGSGVLAEDGSLDRGALGRLVFSDAAARARLNAILHPRIAELAEREVALAPPDAVVVHDVPLLVENGLGPDYQLVLVVAAPVEERVRRLVHERGMDEQEATARIAAQADDAARAAAADVLLDNGGERSELLQAVERLWHDRLVPYEQNLRSGRCASVATTPSAGPAARARAAARLRAALGELGQVEDGDPLVVRIVVDVTGDALAEALQRAGLVLRPDGQPCAADPGAAVAVTLRRDPGPIREE
jgi:dephospho-CoA kinase